MEMLHMVYKCIKFAECTKLAEQRFHATANGHDISNEDSHSNHMKITSHAIPSKHFNRITVDGKYLLV